MNFQVSAIDEDTPALGREGDVYNDPEFIVDHYVASILALDPKAIYAVDSDEDQEEEEDEY